MKQTSPQLLRLYGLRDRLHDRRQAVADRITQAEQAAAEALLDGGPADVTRLVGLRDESRAIRDELRIAELAIDRARHGRRTG